MDIFNAIDQDTIDANVAYTYSNREVMFTALDGQVLIIWVSALGEHISL